MQLRNGAQNEVYYYFFFFEATNSSASESFCLWHRLKYYYGTLLTSDPFLINFLISADGRLF